MTTDRTPQAGSEGPTPTQNLAFAILNVATRFQRGAAFAMQVLDLLRLDPEEVAPVTLLQKVRFNAYQVRAWCGAFAQGWNDAYNVTRSDQARVGAHSKMDSR